MDKRKGIIAGVIIVLLVTVGTVIAVSHKSSNMNMPMSSQSSSTQNAVATNKVTISNYDFGPTSIKVSAGTTVTWTNQDDVHHTITADSGTGPNSSPIDKGQSYSYTFKKAGTYTYHCAIHPEMHGTVVVT